MNELWHFDPEPAKPRFTDRHPRVWSPIWGNIKSKRAQFLCHRSFNSCQAASHFRDHSSRLIVSCRSRQVSRRTPVPLIWLLTSRGLPWSRISSWCHRRVFSKIHRRTRRFLSPFRTGGGSTAGGREGREDETLPEDQLSHPAENKEREK